MKMRATLMIAMLALVPAAALAAAPAQPPQTPPPAMFVTSDQCLACHNGLTAPGGQDVSMGTNWQGSMMAHSAQDPYWQASVRRECQDHPQAAAHIQDECAACHMPMARYTSKQKGQLGKVFANAAAFPGPGGQAAGAPPAPPQALLAADGVSCSMCHQIEAQGLGTPASFTAGFVVDTRLPLGQRRAFGPFKVDKGRQRVMTSAAQLTPTQARHTAESALCGSCHTLYTNALGKDGKVIGRLPEQMPYQEWQHSVYPSQKSCQACHMPVLTHAQPITSVLAQPRKPFSRHVFEGGNFLMLDILRTNAAALAVTAPPRTLMDSVARTKKQLQSISAQVEIQEARVEGDKLSAVIKITNLTGHKLPSAYPSRRAWLRLTVTDPQGKAVFASGGLNPDGSIAGNDNDQDPRAYEPHHQVIETPDQVQIYEGILAGPDGAVTTGLLTAVSYVKDNRLLPHGFDIATAPEDIAVRGRARQDGNYTGGGDTVRLEAPLGQAQGPFTLTAELVYQPIGFRWAHNLAGRNAMETKRFVKLYQGAAPASAVVLAQASAQAP